jgi:hypothetical protein
MDPHHFGNLDPHPDTHQTNKNQDPDPRRSNKLGLEPDPGPRQFADDKPKGMEYEPIFLRVSIFEPFSGSQDLKTTRNEKNV